MHYTFECKPMNRYTCRYTYDPTLVSDFEWMS